MPTVFREKGYRFFFFSNEWNEPIHIHVARENDYAKFWLDPVALVKNYGFSARELTEIRKLVLINQESIKENWHEYFGK